MTAEGILVCECGHKHRNGIPCRHLFALESNCDLDDLACRWQLGYAYFAYHPEHMELTEIFRKRELVDHQGLRLKSWSPKTVGELPMLWEGSQHSVEEILQVANSPVPLAWNCALEACPPQHCLEANSEDDEGCMLSQESVDLPPEGLLEAARNPCEFSFPTTGNVTHAQLLTEFKGMLPLFANPERRKHLLEKLQELKEAESRCLIRDLPSRNASNEGGFVSSNIPFDQDRESHQQTHKRNKLN